MPQRWRGHWQSSQPLRVPALRAAQTNATDNWRPTVSVPIKFAVLLMPLAAMACAPKISNTETEICRAWGETLFNPSRQDTEQTAIWLAEQQMIYGAACD